MEVLRQKIVELLSAVDVNSEYKIEVPEDEYEPIYESFKSHFPDNSPSQLENWGDKQFEYPNYSACFKLPGDVTDKKTGDILVCLSLEGNRNVCDKCNKESECFWSVVNVLHISKNRHDEDYPVFGDFEFDLYPFEQGDELTISHLGFTKDKLESFGYLSYKDDNTHTIGENLFITIDDSNNCMRYIVFSKNIDSTKNTIAAFYDTTYAFQTGDAYTEIFRCKDDLIVDNRGDVSSVVVIKGLFLDVK